MKLLRRYHQHSRNNFVALAAHQLRTLPNIIGWEVESLLAKGHFNPKERHALHQIADANKRMIDMIDTMLNISRIELGSITINPEDVNVTECINEELALLSHAARLRQPHIITKYPSKPAIIRSDKNFIRVILQNLLSNAIKYTPADGHVRVTVTNTSYLLRIEVTDTGCGIPKSQQKHIFKKLFRADNVLSTDISGNGLGLHLTKEIVKLLHGRIWFISEENRGTQFFVELPHKNLRKHQGTTTLVINNLLMGSPNKGGRP